MPKIYEVVVVSGGWNMYRDMRALRFLVHRWNPNIHTFFIPWGKTTITLEDVERICLLPSMGYMNLLELGLFDEEFVIVRKLLDAFGGTSTSWTSNRSRFPYWISVFRESEDTDIRRVAFLSLWMSKCVFNSNPI